MSGKEFNHLLVAKKRRYLMDLEGLAPVAYLCSSSLSVAELLGKKVEFKPKSGFLQLFDHGPEILARILPAYFNALLRQEDGLMKSNEVGNEMLCLVSGEMNVGKAIGKSGIKSAEKFILFVSEEKIAKDARLKLMIDKMERISLKMDLGESGDVSITPISER
ncbi:MAG: hypothetical protein KGH53_01680 [Candidatus Micrarchaeota archaeon]|nr:hypothetical protein [Candidatus Micrarchaeota archaeon]